MFVSLIALLHSCKSIHSKLILKAHERTLIAYFIDYTRLRISTSLLSRTKSGLIRAGLSWVSGFSSTGLIPIRNRVGGNFIATLDQGFISAEIP